MERGQELVLRVRRDGLLDVMALLRDAPQFAFEQLMDICGVDWPERPLRFEVVYNLLSLSRNPRIRVVAEVADGGSVPSVVGLWPCATWFEREAWDMYGIVFEGQTDLRRLLTDYGFEGHPLRKDFPLTGYVEVRYDEERKQVVYEPVKLMQDFRNFDFLSPWEGMTTLPGDEKVHQNRIEEAPKRMSGVTTLAATSPIGPVADSLGPSPARRPPRGPPHDRGGQPHHQFRPAAPGGAWRAAPDPGDEGRDGGARRPAYRPAAPRHREADRVQDLSPGDALHGSPGLRLADVHGAQLRHRGGAAAAASRTRCRDARA